MAILKAIHPHTLQSGERVMAGDYREVPDESVETLLKSDPAVGVVLYVLDTAVWNPAEYNHPVMEMVEAAEVPKGEERHQEMLNDIAGLEKPPSSYKRAKAK